MLSEEFTTRFLSLSGTTMGERRKSLFLLLRQLPDPGQLDFSFQPTSYLEEKFKVDVLIHYRRASELLDLLKSENPVLIKRVLKVPWLLEEAFVGKISGEDLVCKILPFISFNAKAKLLNKLAEVLKEDQGDEFYHAVQKKYGMYLASKLLASCSPQHILNCVKSTRLKLMAKQMLVLAKKRPDHLEDLLNAMSSKNVNVGAMYKTTFKYLSDKNYSLYRKVKSYVEIQFGRRKTKRFLREQKEAVIERPRSYGFLHGTQIAKTLNREYPKFFQNLFPESLDDFLHYNDVVDVFWDLPKKMQDVTMLTSAFEKLYASCFWHCADFASSEFWKLLPLEERYEKMRTAPKPSQMSDDQWVCFKETRESFPHFKKMISLSSEVDARVSLVCCLVETCHLNSDKKALVHLCKYMLTKHRNDDRRVRESFLEAVHDTFLLENLEEEHWTLIHEFIELFALNGEYFSKADQFKEGHVHSRLKQDLPVRKELTNWLKSGRELNIIQSEPQYEKRCLLTFGELLPQLFKEEKNEEGYVDDEFFKFYFPSKARYNFQQRNFRFRYAVESWNGRHPRDRVSFFSYPYVIDTIISLINYEEKDYWDTERLLDYIKCVICQENHCEQRENLLNLYLKTSMHIDGNLTRWLINYRPLIVISNIKQITGHMVCFYSYRQACFFVRWWKNHSHLEGFRDVTGVLLAEMNKVHDENTYQFEFGKPILGLVQLMSTEEFTNFISPYYPTGLVAESKTQKDRTRYALQQQVADHLKFIVPASKALPGILKFCKGDYLEMVQRSLYSVSGVTNEDKLPPFLDELKGRAVSTRKHSMHITLRVMDKERVFGILRYFMEGEINPSLRKFILKAVFNFFVMNPDERMWQLVKTSAKNVEAEDDGAVDILMQVEKIPRQYMAEYITFTWRLLDALPDLCGKRQDSKLALLRTISSAVLEQLPEDFLDHILEYFLKVGNDSLTEFNKQVQEVVVKYIVYCKSEEEQQRRLDAVFDITKNYITHMWNKPEHRECCRKCLSHFVKLFCSKFLSWKSSNKVVFKRFKDVWNSLFLPHQCVTAYLYLEFTMIITEEPHPSVSQLGQKIVELCDSLGATYSLAIMQPFYNTMDVLLSKYTTMRLEEDWHRLIDTISASSSSLYSSALVVFILNKKIYNCAKNHDKREELIETFQKVQNPILDLYLEYDFQGGDISVLEESRNYHYDYD